MISLYVILIPQLEFYQGFITPTTDLGKKAQQRGITDEAGWVPFAIRDFNKSPHNDLGKRPNKKSCQWCEWKRCVYLEPSPIKPTQQSWKKTQ